MDGVDYRVLYYGELIGYWYVLGDMVLLFLVVYFLGSLDSFVLIYRVINKNISM